MDKYTRRLKYRNSQVGIRNHFPDDYHCSCKYCTDNFLGELFDNKNNRYYSQACRNEYIPKLNDKHLCPGHWQGYRFAVQNFSGLGGIVLDPTCGTGTAIIEAINNGRKGIGIELEYSKIAQANVSAQEFDEAIIYHGDAQDLGRIMENRLITKIDLIINGPPYPKDGARSSDAPERKNLNGVDNSFDYEAKENIGLLSGTEYWDSIINMYLTSIRYLKRHGKLVIIVKDLIRNKEPYLLHKELCDRLLDRSVKLRYYGCFIHKHIPPTLFMNTYPKRFPGIKIPLYQTGVVLEKCAD